MDLLSARCLRGVSASKSKERVEGCGGPRERRSRISLRIAAWRLGSAAGSTLAAASIATGVAGATVSSPVVTLKPASGPVSSYFKLQARPGQLAQAGRIVLANPSRKPVTVSLDAVEGETTNTLGSTYSLPGGRIHGAAQWIRLGRRRVTLRPGATQEVSVAAAIPKLVAAGDYLSGISVEALGQSAQTSLRRGLAIATVSRYGIGVELSLPGPRHPLIQFTGASVERQPAGLAFLLSARNAGNVILQGAHGSALVTRGGKPVATSALGPGTFVSGTSIAYPVRAPRETPPEGTVYHVTAVLYYKGGVARLSTDVRFGHASAVMQQNYGGPKLPQKRSSAWTWLVLAGLLALTLAAVLYARRRRRPLSRAAGMRRLAQDLAESVRAHAPLSITLISTPSGGVGSSAQIAKAARSRLRKADRLCDLGEEGLLVISPQTGEEAAWALATDLVQFLAQQPGTPARLATGTASTRRQIAAEQLLARAKEALDTGAGDLSVETPLVPGAEWSATELPGPRAAD